MSDVVDAWLAEARPATAKAEVCFDRELVGEFEKAQEALEEATTEGMLDGPPFELKDRVESLAAEIAAKTRTLVFKNIGMQEWERLRGEHPPTEQQKKEGLDHNPETFSIVATAASCVEPGLTTEQAARLFSMSSTVVARVYGAVMKANHEVGDEKKALAIAATESIASK